MNISRKKLRGFTLIELLAILILLGILLLIAIPLVTHIVKEAKAKICDLNAKTMEIAADNYIARDAITIKIGETRIVQLSELQSAGYISDMYSPYAKREACTGYVVVTNEGQRGNDYYVYQSELKCGNSCVTANYDVSHGNPGTGNTDANDLKDHMKEKNNDWYFEGDSPNNWVKFGMIDGITNRGLLWRIVKLDDTGIKMVYEGLENGSKNPLEDGRALIDGTMGISWNTSGKNKWNEPASLEGKLNEWLSLLNIPDISSYLAKINWKVGGVPYQDPTTIGTFNHYQAISSTDAGGSFDGLSKNESYVGTINAIDFMYTSDNEACVNSYLETGSSSECAYDPSTGEINNFLQKGKYLYWTLNARSDVDNMAWDISNSGLIGSNTVTLSTISVRPVLNLKLNSKFISGTGTIEDPYVLEDYMIGLTDKPVITLNGDSTIFVRQYDSYEDEGATALDKQDGDLTSDISVTGTVNVNTPGNYEIKYDVTDSDGNKAITVTRKVVVIERDLPIIKLNGTNPTYVTITKSYTEPGATAFDINYGDISSSIVTSGSVDTSTLGTYYIKYNVTNEDGMKAPEVTRKVIVKVPVPTILLNGENTVLVDIGTIYNDEGATASDEVDGDLTSSIAERIEYYNPTSKTWQVVSSINTGTVSKYRIRYSVTNSYGSNSFIYRNIQIVKVAGPIITFTPNGGGTSKKTWSTVINVDKRNYDVVTSSQKYMIKSNWSSADVGDIDNYRSSYTDGQTITMTRGTAYYTIYARAFDTYGDLTLKASGRFKLDNSRPYIDINGGTEEILLGHTYRDKGAEAYDDYWDGNITSKITTTSNVDTSKLGTYYVTYKVTDSAGNTTTKSRKVIVYHPQAEIYLKGGSTINLLYGTPYVELGATAYDEIDGNITSNITITGSVDHMHEATYYITYKVTNSSGYTTTRTRTVNVYIPKPVVTLKGSSDIRLLIHTTYVDAGATANDTLDGDLTSRIVTTGSVNPEIPGTYSITYTVTNDLGKTSSATRKITVYKPEPVITITGNSNIELLKTRTYTDLGATATDQIDGNITNKIVTSSTVNTAVAGTYYVTYSVTNSEGITSTKKRTVVVREPNVTITLNGAATVNLPIGRTYVDAGATAYDELLGDVTSSITTTNNINPYTLGTYTVNYRIVTSGVTKTAKRTVKVVPLSGPIITFSKNGDGIYKQNNATTVTVSKSEYDVVPSSIKYVWSTSQTDPSEVSFTTSLTSGDELSTPSGVTGKYYLFVIAKDVYGNTSIMGTNAFYLDNIKPVLTLKGSRVFQTPADSTYADPGVDVLEANSGLDSNGVVITSTIITGVIGTYTVTYNATDKAGNAALPITRTVSVVESRLVDAPGEDFKQLYDASYFVGSNPNNWVEFGNASGNVYDYIPIMWRIIKADGQGIKIIYEGVKNDAKTATNENGTIGTGVWDSTNNIWNRPASIRTNIDNFYTNLNEPDKDTLTAKINWCVGLVNTPYNLDEFKNSSCSTLSDTKSSIGLVDGKDYILTSKDPCDAYNQASCGTNNFLRKNYSYFTSIGDTASSVAIFLVNSNGGLTRSQVTDTMNIRPVVNLRSDVLILGGEGTFENPYKLNKRQPSIDNDPPEVKFSPASSTKNLDDSKVEVVVTDKITGVNNASLKYVWTTTSTQPDISTITNSFTNGDKIEIPPSPNGNYYLWVVAADRKGNQVIAKGGAYISDNTAPVITINGANPSQLRIGDVYTDPGATAIDNLDGNVPVTVTTNLIPSVEGLYTVTYTAVDSNGNTSTATRTVNVWKTIYADSLLAAVRDTTYTNGTYEVTVNGITYSVELINVYDNTTYSADTILGDSTTDKKVLAVKYHGNLTIDPGVTVTATTVNSLTYKKGMLLYVAGDLVNNGTISMTARGTYNQAGEDVYLWKNTDNSYEYIPAIGATGGATVSLTNAPSQSKAGLPGNNGSGRATAGGGSGGVFNNVAGTSVSGAGGAGTSYSGGAGGGATTSRDVTYYGYAGSSTGGAGGAGRSNNYSNSGGYSAGGGAGNPGGVGTGSSCCTHNPGATGTGGLLVIYANNFTNAGSLTSNGVTGGYGTGASGGSSGGGSINIFASNNYTSTGTISVSGGAGQGNGSAGGSGTVTAGYIYQNSYVDIYPTISLSPTNGSTYNNSYSITVNASAKKAGLAGLKYVWTTSSTQPDESLIVNSITSGQTITTPSNAFSGAYYLWVLAISNDGAKTIKSGGPYNVDAIPPIITINGSNPSKLQKDGVYTDLGATATDNRDGTLAVTTTTNIIPSIEGSYSVTYTATDSSGNIATATRTVIVYEVVRSDGLIAAIRDINYVDGNYDVVANGVTYPIELINVYDNTTYSSSVSLGDATTEKKMLVVKYHGDLTINSGVTVTATTVSNLTYKKGMLLYVEGTLTNNGTISMTARGTYNQAGENVYLWQNHDDTFEYIPATGGIGGAAVVRPNNGYNGSVISAGKPGIDGSNRSTGGGGSGTAAANVEGTGVSGAGGTGTSYSGGSGGGGAVKRSSGTSYAGNGSSVGGPGGAAFSSRYSSWYTAGGGAGNAGGLGKHYSTASYDYQYSGATGTGGLLIIYSNQLVNNGSITSNGSSGGGGTAPGGGSGGGSINLFVGNSYTNNGTITANGPATGNGGKGGNGAITVGSISTGTYVPY